MTRWLTGGVAVLMVVTAACAREEAPIAYEDTATQAHRQLDDSSTRDERITTGVQGKYFASDAVKAQNISVQSENGAVTLRGTVENASAKEEAVRLAREVEGVTNVNDELTVASTPSGRAAQGPRADADTMNGGWITTKIQAQYFVNPEINPWSIDVSASDDGIVTLDGEVESAADRAEAVNIARNTDGVNRVNDRLRVRGEAAATTGVRDEARDAATSAENLAERAGAALSDTWITAKIQSKYFLDDEVKGRSIDVESNGGVVTVRGTVGSYAERRQAVAMARNTDGVREVRDELRVDGSIGQPDGQPADDAFVTTKLQSRFFLDEQLRPSDVNVDTKNGVVTLTGTVRSEAAKRAAEEIARDTQGVTRVVNNISVAPQATQRAR